MITEALLIISLLAIFAYLTGNMKKVSGIFAVLAGIVPLLMLLDLSETVGLNAYTHLGFETHASFNTQFFRMTFAVTPLSWFFLLLVGGIFPFIALYAISYFKESPGGFFGSMTLALLGAMGTVLADDLLTLFIFWEITSWSVFLLALRGRSRRTTVTYFTFSLLSATMILIGIMILWNEAGNLSYSAISGSLSASQASLWAIFFMGSGFAVKGAIMPLHVWAPEVYSTTEEPAVAYLSGGLSKLGFYGLFLMFYSFMGVNLLDRFGTFRGVPYIGYFLAIAGAITAFIGTILAFMEDDLRKLLAYSSIGQLGYIAIGIGIGTPLALSGALFQALNHTFFKAVLFLAAGSVFYRTGKWKISELGGVAYRMPFTFMAALFSIFALAAIPITSGFAAKWLLYVSTVNRQFVFLTPVMVIAGVGAFLYSFRILYGVFLGEPRYPDIKEAPPLQLISMWILVLPLMIFLIFPGWLMDRFAAVFSYYGLQGVSHTDFSITTALASYNTLAVIFTLMGTLIVAFAIYKSRKHVVVDHYDNYLAGEILELHEGVSLHAASRFYKPVEDIFRPIFSRGAYAFYSLLRKGFEALGKYMEEIYKVSISYLVMYMLIAMLIIGWWLTW